jgi:hypothetical protein
MTRFVISIALMFGSVGGMAIAAQPAQTVEMNQQESATLYGPYATYLRALEAAAYLEDVGFDTRIIYSGGYYYVQAF